MNNGLIVSGMEGKQSDMFFPLNLNLQYGVLTRSPPNVILVSDEKVEGTRPLNKTNARAGTTRPVALIHCLVGGIMSM